MTDVDDLRIGVIGIGQRAPVALHAHRPGEGARVVGCADPAPDGQSYAGELFGADVAVHPDHQGLLDMGLDAVMVLTPDDQHTEPVLAALRAGVAVFVEKPLAISVEDCDLILETARRTGTRLYVGHNLRHLPALREMRRLIDEGVIGTVKAVWCRHFVGHGGDYYFKDWHADRRRTLGLLLQKGAHDLDVIHWLAGAPSRTVVAMGDLAVYGDPRRRRTGEATPGARMPDWFDATRWPPAELDELNPVVDVEDISMMMATLSNGVLASYQQCHFTPDYWRNYTVIGDAGRMENFGDAVGEGDAEIRVWNHHRSGYRADADLTVPVTEQAGSHGGADEALVAEFLRFAAEGGATDTSPVAAREAVAAGVAATRSLRTGSPPVRVPELDPDLVAYFAAGQSST
ncbi:Gfo/Idh/MocA family oxidoreductase [Umezawaea sp. Da 62-37]|uniref:Gfo/Idh/MocA family protein n=1 Tax=Umezawaea sp. Da 62-37 TaxID=3075927 RepID=UPI0028F6F94B|nr:Gfo/Idh/MocA family oxidoreductase [Umezawaea sp. Da 62-37]WNV87551.1 Gfo/Idh/MocA family oxidoreductase [Umezawaea sp. Da 62-37]